MAALLFDRGVSPLEIESMNYAQLRYWAELTESLNKRDNPEYRKMLGRKNA